MSLDPKYLRRLAKRADDIMMSVASVLSDPQMSEDLKTFVLAHGHHAEDHLKAARDDLDRIAELLEGK